MNKLCITAMAAAIAFAAAGCSSDSASSSTASKASQVTGKLTTPVFVKVDGKSQGGDSEFKLGKTSNIYHATAFMDKGQHKILIADAKDTCGTKFGPAAAQALTFGTTAQMDKCAKNEFTINVVLKGNYDFTLDYTKDAPSVKVLRSTKKVEVKRQPPQIACDKWDGGPVTANVGKAFPNGTTVRDAYSGATAVVKGGKVTMTPAPESEGILLLEEAKSYSQAPFSWDNANVYFMLPDRFYNGNKSNDNSYGRKKDGKNEIGTWHGGDFAGITQKLDYLRDLGVNAIWVTPIVEQVHGFVSGGAEGSFPFYGYHGYWALDFTNIDKNLGTEEEFQRFVDEAHKRGIRILVDVVMNHAGYATLKDLQDIGLRELVRDPDSLPADWSDYKPKGLYATWGSINGVIDYKTKAWKKWWGPEWVRAGLPGYDEPGVDDQNMAVGGLPDFKTEKKTPVKLPEFFKNKKDTKAVDLPNASIVDYLVSWHTYYVRKFGVDGFRCDTVKHVDPYAWKQLKTSATTALKEWKAENPSKKIDDTPFFMVGEVFDHGVSRDLWYDNGFDSLLNFDYQKESMTAAQCMKEADGIYAKYAKSVQQKGFNILSYISSHDTKLFFADYQDFNLQKRTANSFLMLPGQVQIYYGDESGRPLMKDDGVVDQSLRSDMNWADLDKPEYKDLIQHWAKLNKFRLNHPAVAEGTHTKLSASPYAFMRKKGNDKVVIVSAGRK
ncbi:MAG: alpha-amylase [Succinimonas sp.]|nr:alpha-amylase [Succinimonas sp.]